MVSGREVQQRKEFCKILFDLAKQQDLFQDAHYRSDIYRRLELLYDAEEPEKRFRHFYSDIFVVLTQIQQNKDLGNIDILGQNLELIRNGYQSRNKSADGKRFIDVSDSIKKLYDHVSLDIARITYSDAADRRISGESSLSNLQSQINELQMELQKAQNIKEDCDKAAEKITEVETRLDNSQKEYIAILGIFAAVVLAFTGGIAFSTSVLENIGQVSAYRIVTVALIIGIVFINIVFGLFYYINSLVNKEKKLKPLIVSNTILIGLLIVTIIIWLVGGVESRNERIHLRTQNKIQKMSES